jgi:outer membrane protein
MKLSKFIFIELLFFLLQNSNSYFAQKNLSLEEAIKIALNQNTSIITNTNNLKTLEGNLKSAYGNLIPSLNIGTSWGWQRVSDNGGKTQIDYFGNQTTLGPSETDSRSYSFGVNGNVTLFDGLSNFYTINQSKNNLESAKFDLEKLKQDAILQTINYYVAIINADKLLKFQEEDLKFNNSMLDKIKEMFDLKMITISDVYAQQVQAANSELSYLQAQNNFEKAKILLLDYLSIDVNNNYTFDSDDSKYFDTSSTNRNFEDLFKEALNNRQDYQSQILKNESAQYQLSIAKSNLLPQLDGNYSFSTNAVQPGDLFSRRIYSVGLSLSLPIFSHWSTDYSIQFAKVQLENGELQISALARQVKSDIKNAVLDLQTAKKQYDVSKTAVQSAQANWQIKKDAYTLGSATFIDQQQTYRDYLQTEYNMINQEQNYLLKQFALINAIGNLTKL